MFWFFDILNAYPTYLLWYLGDTSFDCEWIHTSACNSRNKGFFVVNKSKGESQNGCYKKTKHAKFFRRFLTLWYTHMRLRIWGGKKCSFFEKFAVLSFLVTPVLRFAFLPYYRRVMIFVVEIISYVSLFWKMLQSA